MTAPLCIAVSLSASFIRVTLLLLPDHWWKCWTGWGAYGALLKTATQSEIILQLLFEKPNSHNTCFMGLGYSSFWRRQYGILSQMPYCTLNSDIYAAPFILQIVFPSKNDIRHFLPYLSFYKTTLSGISFSVLWNTFSVVSYLSFNSMILPGTEVSCTALQWPGLTSSLSLSTGTPGLFQPSQTSPLFQGWLMINKSRPQFSSDSFQVSGMQVLQLILKYG